MSFPYIDRASAHPGDDTGRLQILPAEFGQDDIPLGLVVVENAQDIDIKLFDFVLFKDSPAFSLLSGLDLVQRQDIGKGGGQGGRQCGQQDRG